MICLNEVFLQLYIYKKEKELYCHSSIILIELPYMNKTVFSVSGLPFFPYLLTIPFLTLGRHSQF